MSVLIASSETHSPRPPTHEKHLHRRELSRIYKRTGSDRDVYESGPCVRIESASSEPIPPPSVPNCEPAAAGHTDCLEPVGCRNGPGFEIRVEGNYKACTVGKFDSQVAVVGSVRAYDLSALETHNDGVFGERCVRHTSESAGTGLIEPKVDSIRSS